MPAQKRQDIFQEFVQADNSHARKFGGYGQADEIIGRVTNVAAGCGLDFHLERAQRANTLLAHRLLWAAEHEGGSDLQIALKIKAVLRHTLLLCCGLA